MIMNNVAEVSASKLSSLACSLWLLTSGFNILVMKLDCKMYIFSPFLLLATSYNVLSAQCILFLLVAPLWLFSLSVVKSWVLNVYVWGVNMWAWGNCVLFFLLMTFNNALSAHISFDLCVTLDNALNAHVSFFFSLLLCDFHWWMFLNFESLVSVWDVSMWTLGELCLLSFPCFLHLLVLVHYYN